MYYLPKILRKINPVIKKNSKFQKDTAVEGGSIILNSNFDCHSYCGYYCEIFNTSIGKYSSIGNNVIIGLQNHRLDLLSTSPCFVRKKDSIKFKVFDAELPNVKTTTIGNDVWIGTNAILKAGINVGNGAVIGMGSVVTKDVPPYAIVAGNPAKIIRFRFDKKTIDFLEKNQWWNLSDKQLKEMNGFSGNPEIFLKWIKKTNV